MADPADAGSSALKALERALAHRPERDGEAFSAVTEHLCRMRDGLIHDCRGGAPSHDKLGQLNAIISCTLAGHFPLGNTLWPVVEQARDALRTLLIQL